MDRNAWLALEGRREAPRSRGASARGPFLSSGDLPTAGTGTGDGGLVAEGAWRAERLVERHRLLAVRPLAALGPHESNALKRLLSWTCQRKPSQRPMPIRIRPTITPPPTCQNASARRSPSPRRGTGAAVTGATS